MAAGVVGNESFEDDAARGAGLAVEVRAFFAFLRISRILRFCSILPCDAVELPDVTVSGMEEIDDFLEPDADDGTGVWALNSHFFVSSS